MYVTLRTPIQLWRSTFFFKNYFCLTSMTLNNSSFILHLSLSRHLVFFTSRKHPWNVPRTLKIHSPARVRGHWPSHLNVRFTFCRCFLAKLLLQVSGRDDRFSKRFEKIHSLALLFLERLDEFFDYKSGKGWGWLPSAQTRRLMNADRQCSANVATRSTWSPTIFVGLIFCIY